MYIVIFRATVNELDDDYHETAARLRNRAITEYNCIEFTSAFEGNQEIALSYWHSLDDIKTWKRDLEHLTAQHKGKERWYKAFSVEITKTI